MLHINRKLKHLHHRRDHIQPPRLPLPSLAPSLHIALCVRINAAQRHQPYINISHVATNTFRTCNRQVRHCKAPLRLPQIIQRLRQVIDRHIIPQRRKNAIGRWPTSITCVRSRDQINVIKKSDRTGVRLGWACERRGLMQCRKMRIKGKSRKRRRGCG